MLPPDQQPGKETATGRRRVHRFPQDLYCQMGRPRGRTLRFFGLRAVMVVYQQVRRPRGWRLYPSLPNRRQLSPWDYFRIVQDPATLGSERYCLFYKRGCQEHFSPSTGGADMVRDVQPVSTMKDTGLVSCPI